MNQQEALDVVKKCVATACPAYTGDISLETDLIAEKILDSLDSMNFLFELESSIGTNIPEIDEDYGDFRVSKIVDLVLANIR